MSKYDHSNRAQLPEKYVPTPFLPSTMQVEWINKLFGWVPTWKMEPNLSVVERIARRTLGLIEDDHFQISFFAQGGFNKLFLIGCSKGDYIFRVALPVYPLRKTRSEVATISWIHENTSIPIPAIVAYDASSTNELGFEWILMKMIPGQTLRRAWRTMSLEKKKDLVRTIASYQAELLEKTNFNRIGNIYGVDGKVLGTSSNSTTSSTPKQFQIGPMVSTSFFWADRSNLDKERGPFSNSKDWLSIRLELLLRNPEQELEETQCEEDADEEDVEDAEKMLRVGRDLNEAFNELFRPCGPSLEAFVLWHDDLSDTNILVDEDNQITGIIDWESVSVLPVWYSKHFPTFLEGPDREREPIVWRYAADEGESNDKKDISPLDNQGITSLYWEHLLEYKQTLLRQTYLNEMERFQPGFMKDRDSFHLQLGFEYAITQGDNPFMARRIRSWLSDIRNGNIWDLTKPKSTEL